MGGDSSASLRTAPSSEPVSDDVWASAEVSSSLANLNSVQIREQSAGAPPRRTPQPRVPHAVPLRGSGGAAFKTGGNMKLGATKLGATKLNANRVNLDDDWSALL